MFVLKVSLTQGDFTGWQGFAMGGWLTTDIKGEDLLEPRHSLALTESPHMAAVLALNEAEALAHIFISQGGHEIEVVTLAEAQGMQQAIQESNKKFLNPWIS